MTQSLSRSVFGFAVLFIGLATTAFAAEVAYDGSDTDSNVVETFHPVVESILPLLPYVLLIVVAMATIAFGVYLKEAGPGGNLR